MIASQLRCTSKSVEWYVGTSRSFSAVAATAICNGKIPVSMAAPCCGQSTVQLVSGHTECQRLHCHTLIIMSLFTTLINMHYHFGRYDGLLAGFLACAADGTATLLTWLQCMTQQQPSLESAQPSHPRPQHFKHQIITCMAHCGAWFLPCPSMHHACTELYHPQHSL